MNVTDLIQHIVDEGNVVGMFQSRAKGHGDRLYLETVDRRRSFTYADAWKTSCQVAAGLQAEGVLPGTRICLSIPNSPEFLFAFAGCMIAGAIPVLTNPEAPNSELRVLAERAEAEILIVRDVELKARSEIEGLRPLSVETLDGSGPVGANMPSLPYDARPDELAYIIYSGGTTGSPKGCEITHDNMLRELAATVAAHALPENCVHLCVLPLFHASALYRNLFCPMAEGNKTVIAPSFHADLFWNWVRDFRIGYVQLVPTIINLLLSSHNEPDPKISEHVQFIGSASGPLSAMTIKEFEARFGVLVGQGYGLTEVSCGACFNDPRRADRRLDSVGHPLAFSKVTIREDGRELQSGEIGEVFISGPVVMRGYIGGDEGSGKALVGQTLQTGDIGYIDENGFVVIEGRKSDVIHRGGYKIAPKEVEEAILTIPEVQSVVVFGVPHEVLGEDIVASVVFRSGKTISEPALRSRLRSMITPYKVPSRFVTLHGADTGNGSAGLKLSRAALRDRYLDRRGSYGQKSATPTLRRDNPHKFKAFRWGETVYLRPLERSDLDNRDYIESLTDPEVQYFTHTGRFPQTEESMVAFWQSLKPPNAAAFAICDLESDEHVGNVLLRIDWIARTAEFGRLMFKRFQNRPYSGEALKIALEYAFEDLKLARVWGGGANPSSIPSLIRLGFVLEGRLRSHDLLGGERRDKFIVGMLAQEYFDRKDGVHRPPRTTHYNLSPALMERLQAVFADAFGVAHEVVTAQSSPETIEGWDSLGMVVLWSLLEENFDILIESGDMLSVTNVGDIGLMVNSKLAGETGSPE
jgi:acyl-CoA synthetase (AMP-forming)/AMP-acid ligase II/RimJ/RimL family protein N-acetyltransferase/acyl carrier protein